MLSFYNFLDEIILERYFMYEYIYKYKLIIFDF